MGRAYTRQDGFYQKAKESGYRSRASFKLIELYQKHGKALIPPKGKVLDLGAWPGGWLQVASKYVGTEGLVVGVDLTPIDPFQEENIYTICGDARDDEIIAQLIDCGSDMGHKLSGVKFDAVLSDMSPKLSGVKEVDRAGLEGCAELALFIAEKVLKEGGALVIKLFKSTEADLFFKNIRPRFKKCDRIGLQSTRNSSKEYYLVCLSFIK